MDSHFNVNNLIYLIAHYLSLSSYWLITFHVLNASSSFTLAFQFPASNTLSKDKCFMPSIVLGALIFHLVDMTTLPRYSLIILQVRKPPHDKWKITFLCKYYLVYTKNIKDIDRIYSIYSILLEMLMS